MKYKIIEKHNSIYVKLEYLQEMTYEEFIEFLHNN